MKANHVKWAFIMNAGQQCITAVVMLLLASMLGPSSFGLLAMAMVYVVFVQLIMEQGLGAALIQRPELRNEQMTSAFWVILVWSMLLWVVSILLSSPWANLNGVPELAPVLRALSLLIPIQALTVVQQAILRRNLKFRSLAIRSTAASLAGGAVGVILAVAGMGVWALVGQQLSTAAVGSALLWIVSDWRPRGACSLRHLRELWAFSASAFTDNIGVFLRNRSDALLMGLFFGPIAVGLYRLADRLMSVGLTLTTRSITAVALPTLSRLQTDRRALKTAVLRSIHISATITIPAMALVAALSGPLMTCIGDEWQAAAVALRLLAIVGVIQAFTLFTPPLLQAIGKPHWAAVLTWVSAFASAACFVAAALLWRESPTNEQIAAIAWSRVVVFGAMYAPLNIYLLRRAVGITVVQLAATVLPSVLASSVGAASAIVVVMAMEATSPVSALFTGAIVGMLATGAAIAAIDGELRRWIIGRTQQWFDRSDAPGSNPSGGVAVRSAPQLSLKES